MTVETTSASLARGSSGVLQGQETGGVCRGPEADAAASRGRAGGPCGWSREEESGRAGPRGSQVFVGV